MLIRDWSSDVCSSDLDRAPSRAPGRANAAVPLFVDVDGTLTRADISLESFVRIGRSSIAALIAVLAWLEIGRTSFRERVCQDVLMCVVVVSLKQNTKIHNS